MERDSSSATSVRSLRCTCQARFDALSTASFAASQLGVDFQVFGEHEGKSATRTNVDIWQPGATLSYVFPGVENVEVSDIEGAVRVPTATAGNELTLRLSELEAEEEQAVRFRATNVHHLPELTCTPSLPFPPPTPPLPPPTPPPFLRAAQDDCFLGGVAALVDPPCLGVCSVSVTLQRWQVGVWLTINFAKENPKSRASTAPARLRSAKPENAVRMTDSTKHSIMLELQNSPTREFRLLVQLSGHTSTIDSLSCCCTDGPTPPPPPPPVPMPPPSPSPPPPPSPGFPGVRSSIARNGIIQGSLIAEAAAPPPPPPRSALSANATTGAVVVSLIALASVAFAFKQIAARWCSAGRPGLLPGPGGEPVMVLPDAEHRQEIAAKGGGAAAGRAKPRKVRAGVTGATQAADDSVALLNSQSERAPPKGQGGTLLSIELSKDERATVDLSLESIDSFAQLQELVADSFEAAGFDPGQLDRLAMGYTSAATGTLVVATQSTALEDVKASANLRLAPAAALKKGTKPSGGKAKVGKKTRSAAVVGDRL